MSGTLASDELTERVEVLVNGALVAILATCTSWDEQPVIETRERDTIGEEETFVTTRHKGWSINATFADCSAALGDLIDTAEAGSLSKRLPDITIMRTGRYPGTGERRTYAHRKVRITDAPRTVQPGQDSEYRLSFRSGVRRITS